MLRLPGLRGRFGVLVLLSVLYLCIQTILRVWLMLSSGAWPGGIFGAALILGAGVVSDLFPLALAGGAAAVWLAAVPASIWRRGWHRGFVTVAAAFILALMLLEAVAECLFWAEFETRFNFLAVEYLVYHDEVARNILESYAVGPMTVALMAVAAMLLWLLRRVFRDALEAESPGRVRAAVAFACVAAAAVAAVAPAPEVGANSRAVELSRNGAYQFVSAFRTNELDYTANYISRPPDEVMRELRVSLITPPPDGAGITRRVNPSSPERRLNVVMIVVESLSGSFLGAYGAPRGLTPNLDALAAKSLWFSNVYATGTRTVRGLEALTLSIPPTPGHSIVKRPGSSGGLRTIGTPFQERGYDTAFLYGGYGYFDNMNAFFDGAGFRTVDRASMTAGEISFSNAWGVADENLLDRTLREADADWARGQPFLFMALTTSNHRPYTFPEGRIDLPPRSRDAAVKYTDWAIGKFLQDAATRPWFDDTIFVVVADHCARSGGRTELPVENFRIPLFIYAPAIVAPRRVTTLVSQIDVAPTLLQMLGFSYVSTFFGRDMLAAGEERAFLATYSALGLLRRGQLTVLEPEQRALAYAVSGDVLTEKPVDRTERDAAIGYYQGAAQVYRSGALNLSRSEGRPRAAARHVRLRE
jgi:phosphoglycerol transferase MdoB-like AlkP superfamily enzyme